MPSETNRPVHKISSGVLSGSIWKQVREQKAFYSVTFQRAYTDDEGKTWKHTDSFGYADLLTVGGIAGEAWRWILDAKLSEKAAERKAEGN